MEKEYLVNKILEHGGKVVEKSLPMEAKLLSIILYSDTTNVNMLGKRQLHPIYTSIGNIN